MKKPDQALAIQMSHKNGERHIVGIGNLRVIIVPDGKHYFAQGLEIDYAAQGVTVEQAKTNFEIGLKNTIDQNLRIHGTIKPILRPAPDAVWQELTMDDGAVANRYFQVTSHHTPHRALPYEGIDFLVESVNSQEMACAR